MVAEVSYAYAYEEPNCYFIPANAASVPVLLNIYNKQRVASGLFPTADFYKEFSILPFWG